MKATELSFWDHIQLKINKAYIILSLIEINFIYMDNNTFIMLYKYLVRPHLEYANSVWCTLKSCWMFQNVKYDYTVDLTGSGDRSEFETKNY